MKFKGNADKAKFRATKEWKEFRRQLISERGTYCECCKKKTKALQVHHMYQNDYTNLSKDRFALVCALCHKCISDVEKIKPENRLKLRAEWYIKQYGQFLKG